MTDIKNILAKHGLTVPADKLAEFEKDFRENQYKKWRDNNSRHFNNIKLKLPYRRLFYLS